MRDRKDAYAVAARCIAGAAILLTLSTAAVADQGAFSSYIEACEHLHQGESRADSARRFADVVTHRPADRFSEAAATLAESLKRMAIEDAAFREPADPGALVGRERIDYLIFKLRDVAEREFTVPGKTHVLFFPKTPNSPALALRKIGKPAVPALLALLQDARPTRSYSGPMNGACILRHNDVALEILEAIAGRRFDSRTERGAYLSTADEATRARIIAGVNGWWEKNRQRDEADWLLESLEETGLGAMWDHLAIADRLIELQGSRSVDFFRHRLQSEPDNPWTITMLWKAGGKAVLGDIRPLANSKLRPVRQAALRVLVEAGEPGAVQTVVRTLDSLPAEEPPVANASAAKQYGEGSLRDHRRSLLSILAFSGTEEGTLAAAKCIENHNNEFAEDAILSLQYALNPPGRFTPALRVQVLPFMARALDRRELSDLAAWWIIKSEHLAIEWPAGDPSGPAGPDVMRARDGAVQSVKAWIRQHEDRQPAP